MKQHGAMHRVQFISDNLIIKPDHNLLPRL